MGLGAGYHGPPQQDGHPLNSVLGSSGALVLLPLGHTPRGPSPPVLHVLGPSRAGMMPRPAFSAVRAWSRWLGPHDTPFPHPALQLSS